MPRKTAKSLIVFLVFSISLTLPLSAESWRYCVWGEDESYLSLVSGALSLFDSAESEEALSSVRERGERKGRIEEEKSRATLLEREDFTALERLTGYSYEEKGAVRTERVTLDLEQWKSFLRSGDEDAYRFLMLKNNLDALFYVASEGEGSIRDITLMMNGRVIRKAYYYSSLSSYEEEELMYLFSDMLSGAEEHVYKLDFSPSFASLSIDGEILSSSSPFVVLRNGEHTFSLSAYGYKEIERTVYTDGSEREISFEMEEAEPHSLYVSSIPWSSEMRINGEYTEGKYVESIHSPYILTLEHEGFRPLSFQTSSEEQSIRLSLTPEWSGNENILERKKGDFYKSIFTTLISFGGYTALSAMEKIDSTPLNNTLKVVFNGASIVSLINLVRCAAEYYSAAGLGT